MRLMGFTRGQSKLYAGRAKAIYANIRRALDASWFLNSSEFFAPLKSSLTLDRGTGSATFARNSTPARDAYVQDHEGILRLCKKNEARFTGARRVENLVQTNSEDASEVGTYGLNSGVTATTTTLTFAGGANYWYRWCTSALANHQYVARLTLSSSDKATIVLRITGAAQSASKVVTLTTTPTTYSVAITPNADDAGSGFVFGLDNRSGVGGDQLSGTVTATYWQLQDKTGASDPTVPDEYVSVGVESAPYIQTMADGPKTCGVDGVAYSEVENPCTVASNVVTQSTTLTSINSSNSKFAYLPGVSGAYFSTPHATANQVTGDIEVIVDVALADWSPATTNTFIAKDDAGANRNWFFRITSTSLAFTVFVGGVEISLGVTHTGTFTDGVRYQLKVTRASATGKVNFYYAPAGSSTFTQISTEQSGTAGAIDNDSVVLSVGAFGNGSTDVATGKIYRATISNSIGGAAVVDFNPNLSTTAQTFTAATGEVWTTNGGARIFGNTHATYGIPAPWDADGPVGYKPEGARENLQPYSADFSSWTIAAGASVAANSAVAPDGTTSADTVSVTAGDYQAVSYSTVIAADTATYTLSFYVKKTVGATSFPGVSLAMGGTYYSVAINTNTGVVTGRTGELPVATTSELSPDGNYYRVSITGPNTSAAALFVYFYGRVNADASATWTGGQGSATFWGAQVELGSFASSYIPTTTAAVTRAADVLTYPTSGNVSGTAGTCFLEYALNVVVTANNLTLSSANGNIQLCRPQTSTLLQAFDGANNPELATVSARSIGTRYKAAAAWGNSSVVGAEGGVTDGAKTFAATVGFDAALCIGGSSSGTSSLFGNIRNVRIAKHQLDPQYLVQLTSN